MTAWTDKGITRGFTKAFAHLTETKAPLIFASSPSDLSHIRHSRVIQDRAAWSASLFDPNSIYLFRWESASGSTVRRSCCRRDAQNKPLIYGLTTPILGGLRFLATMVVMLDVFNCCAPTASTRGNDCSAWGPARSGIYDEDTFPLYVGMPGPWL